MKDILNYDLTAHNTFGIAAHCRRFVEFSSVGELQSIVRSLTSAEGPYLLLGGGSNLLLTTDYPGTVLHSAIRGIEPTKVDGGVLLRVGSGETWDGLVALCVEQGWHGAENLSLIPGEVGASAVQNIGAYGVEVKDLIYKVEAVDLQTAECVVFNRDDCEYGYRQSRFKHDWRDRYMITYVTYRMSDTFCPDLDYGNIRAELDRKGIGTPDAAELRRVIIDIRNSKLPDPAVEGNAGSFFMNPIVPRDFYERLAVEYPTMPHYDAGNGHVKIPAGWLIEQCGWKGRALGPAAVHSRQALVLVNKGGASGKDILRLCEAVQADVKRKFGIEIHPEVNIQ